VADLQGFFVMRIIIGTLLWAVFIVGALPAHGQRELEYRFAWWHSRFMGIVSSFVEALCGWQFLREVLFRSELHVLSPEKAFPLGVVGFYMLVEGLLRLGVTLRLPNSALPSLPVLLIFKGITAITKKKE
jgi:hypothetical protein